MPVSITGDYHKLVNIFGAAEGQFPFAAAKALNECAVLFQQEERALMQREFTIRRPWVLQGVKIGRGDFATKSRLSVRISIDRSRDFFNKFEGGGVRTPTGGRRALTIPLTGGEAKKSPTSVVPDALRPRELNFKSASKKGSFTVLKGDKGTFLIQRPDGSGIILKRKTRAIAVKRRHHGPLQKGQRHDWKVVTLYVLKPRTKVPDSLHFEETARSSFAKNWPNAFTKWWNEAVRTMNTGSPLQQGQALPSGWQG